MNEQRTDGKLIQFVRDRNGNPRGVLVAKHESEHPGEVVIGWSYTNIRAGDRFDKQRGLEIADARVEAGTDKRPPNDVARTAVILAARAKRYFHVERIHLAGPLGYEDFFV